MSFRKEACIVSPSGGLPQPSMTCSLVSPGQMPLKKHSERQNCNVTPVTSNVFPPKPRVSRWDLRDPIVPSSAAQASCSVEKTGDKTQGDAPSLLSDNADSNQAGRLSSKVFTAGSMVQRRVSRFDDCRLSVNGSSAQLRKGFTDTSSKSGSQHSSDSDRLVRPIPVMKHNSHSGNRSRQRCKVLYSDSSDEGVEQQGSLPSPEERPVSHPVGVIRHGLSVSKGTESSARGIQAKSVERPHLGSVDVPKARTATERSIFNGRREANLGSNRKNLFSSNTSSPDAGSCSKTYQLENPYAGSFGEASFRGRSRGGSSSSSMSDVQSHITMVTPRAKRRLHRVVDSSSETDEEEASCCVTAEARSAKPISVSRRVSVPRQSATEDNTDVCMPPFSQIAVRDALGKSNHLSSSGVIPTDSLCEVAIPRKKACANTFCSSDIVAEPATPRSPCHWRVAKACHLPSERLPVVSAKRDSISVTSQANILHREASDTANATPVQSSSSNSWRKHRHKPVVEGSDYRRSVSTAQSLAKPSPMKYQEERDRTLFNREASFSRGDFSRASSKKTSIFKPLKTVSESGFSVEKKLGKTAEVIVGKKNCVEDNLPVKLKKTDKVDIKRDVTGKNAFLKPHTAVPDSSFDITTEAPRDTVLSVPGTTKLESTEKVKAEDLAAAGGSNGVKQDVLSEDVETNSVTESHDVLPSTFESDRKEMVSRPVFGSSKVEIYQDEAPVDVDPVDDSFMNLVDKEAERQGSGVTEEALLFERPAAARHRTSSNAASRSARNTFSRELCNLYQYLIDSGASRFLFEEERNKRHRNETDCSSRRGRSGTTASATHPQSSSYGYCHEACEVSSASRRRVAATGNVQNPAESTLSVASHTKMPKKAAGKAKASVVCRSADDFSYEHNAKQNRVWRPFTVRRLGVSDAVRTGETKTSRENQNLTNVPRRSLTSNMRRTSSAVLGGAERLVGELRKSAVNQTSRSFSSKPVAPPVRAGSVQQVISKANGSRENGVLRSRSHSSPKNVLLAVRKKVYCNVSRSKSAERMANSSTKRKRERVRNTDVKAKVPSVSKSKLPVSAVSAENLAQQAKEDIPSSERTEEDTVEEIRLSDASVKEPLSPVVSRFLDRRKRRGRAVERFARLWEKQDDEEAAAAAVMDVASPDDHESVAVGTSLLQTNVPSNAESDNAPLISFASSPPSLLQKQKILEHAVPVVLEDALTNQTACAGALTSQAPVESSFVCNKKLASEACSENQKTGTVDSKWRHTLPLKWGNPQFGTEFLAKRFLPLPSCTMSMLICSRGSVTARFQ